MPIDLETARQRLRESLADALNQAMEDEGVSNQELGDLTGFPPSVFWRLRHATEVDIALASLARVGAALGCHVVITLVDPGDPTPEDHNP